MSTKTFLIIRQTNSGGSRREINSRVVRVLQYLAVIVRISHLTHYTLADVFCHGVIYADIGMPPYPVR